MSPRITQQPGIEGQQLLPEAGQLQQVGACGNQQPDGELHRGHALHQLQLEYLLQQRDITGQRRPRSEGDEGRRQRDAGRAGQRQRAAEVAARMVLGQTMQYVVVHRLHGRGDEQAAAAPQLGQQFGVVDQVLDLDGGVERQLGKRVVQRPRQPQAVGGAVEEVRVAKRNVRRPGPYLLVNVLHHHLDRDDAERPLVHRHHRTVAAQVLAAPAALGKACHPGGAVRQHQVGVAGQRRQAAAVRSLERDPVQADHGFALHDRHRRLAHRRAMGPQPPGNGQQRRLHFPAQHAAHAQPTQQRLVHRGVEPVHAKVGMRGEPPDVGQGFHGDAGGGMHADIQRHQAGIPEQVGVELLQRKVEAGHRKTLVLEHGGRLGQGERLAPQFVRVDQHDPEWRRASGRCRNLGQHGQ